MKSNLNDQNVNGTKTKSKLESDITKRHEFLLSEGRKCAGIAAGSAPSKPPLWYDPAAFGRAQELYSTFAPILSITQAYGLYFGLYHYEAMLPLLTTGNSSKTSKLFCRYLSTFLHLRVWFENDPFDPNCKAFRSLRIVRGLHRQVGTKLNQEMNRKNGQDNMWLSQHMMVETQFAFFGLMALFPKELGYHCFSTYDFHCIFHFWRTVGYILGIEDRFNLCSGTDEEIVELCRQIYHNEWIPMIRTYSDKTAPVMCKQISNGIENINLLANFNAMYNYAAPFLGLDKNNFPLENASEKRVYYYLKWLMQTLSRSWTFMWCFTKTITIWIEFKIKYFIPSYEQMLALKYDDQFKFEIDERCPFKVDLNYQDVFQAKLA